MTAIDIDDIKGLVGLISSLVEQRKNELIRLDGAVGDGDLGLTMSKGFRAMVEEAGTLAEPDVGKLLMKLGMSMAKAAPSTMGTLVATGFMAGGKAVSGATSLDPARFSAFFSAFVEGVMQRGKSKPGEKTLLDVIHPAAQALAEAVTSGLTLEECAQRMYDAARTGYETSKGLVAQHGRAAYYGEQSRGKEDPGAAAALIIIKGMHDYVTGHT